MLQFIKDLKRPTIVYSIILIITIISAYIICRLIGFNPEVLFDDLGVESVSHKNPTAAELFLALFKNNIQVPLQILLLALLPIPFVYSIVLVFNGITIGSFFYIYEAVQHTHGEGDPLFSVILKDFLPHAVIELLAFIIATALAYRINQWIFRNIIRLFQKQNKWRVRYTFKQILLYSIITFAAIIFPLILIAAFIEAFITPII